MRHPREWSNAAWLLAGATIVGMLVLAVTVDPPSWDALPLENGSRAAAIIGVLVGLTSLVSTAVSTGLSTRRQRRQATLEAWSKWSDDTLVSRRFLTANLGSAQLTRAQSDALMGTGGALLDRHGSPVPDEVRLELRHALNTLLNGLERIAVGANLGLYDDATLREVGGTIIARHFERAEAFIEYRRTTESTHKRQERAFLALEDLVKRLKRRDLDSERLKRLRT